ncbi:MAG: hypothetical protein IKZ62_02270 [Prevotella sp.]|nr:hypothetical protein [Prevotella sp.]
MKKFMMTLAAVLCCAMTTAVFTSCGGGDDNSYTPPEPKLVGCQIDYRIDIPKEEYQNNVGNCGNVFLLFDKIEVGYLDENGQEQREVVNNGKWSKSVIYKKDMECNLKLYLTKPASIDVESLPYEYYTSLLTFNPYEVTEIMGVYSDGTLKDPTFSSCKFTPHQVRHLTFKKSNVTKYIEDISKQENILMTITFRL